MANNEYEYIKPTYTDMTGINHGKVMPVKLVGGDKGGFTFTYNPNYSPYGYAPPTVQELMSRTGEFIPNGKEDVKLIRDIPDEAPVYKTTGSVPRELQKLIDDKDSVYNSKYRSGVKSVFKDGTDKEKWSYMNIFMPLRREYLERYTNKYIPLPLRHLKALMPAALMAGASMVPRAAEAAGPVLSGLGTAGMAMDLYNGNLSRDLYDAYEDYINGGASTGGYY